MLADRKQSFEAWWKTYPPERRVKKSACRMAYDMALYQLKADQDCDEPEAMQYLLDRTRRFAASPLANDKFCMSSERWLAERRWEDDDAAWGYKRTRAPVKSTSALEDVQAFKAQVDAEKASGKVESLAEITARLNSKIKVRQ